MHVVNGVQISPQVAAIDGYTMQGPEHVTHTTPVMHAHSLHTPCC